MKKIAVFFWVFLFLGAGISFGQVGGCGTEGSDAYAKILKQDLQLLEQYEGQFTSQMIARTLTLVDLPVQFHVVRTTAGQSPVTQEMINQAMANLNGYFQNAGLRFFECSSAKYINDSNLSNFNSSMQGILVGKSYTAKVVNIYCVGSIDGGTIAGYTYLPGSGQPDIILMDDGVLTSATLPHEMGHFFGLLHTHGTANCASSGVGTNELVDGSNCSFAGDLVCDTPADPGLLGAGCSQLVVDVNCNYIGSARDANGALFKPDVHNVMSYSRSACRDRMSPGQYARINAAFNQYRTYLKCAASPPVSGRLSLGASLTFNPGVIRKNTTFSVTTKVKNTGSVKFAGKVKALVFNSQGVNLGVMGEAALTDSLGIGETLAQALSFTAPFTLAEGSYKVGLYYQFADGAFELVGNELYPSYIDFQVLGDPMPCDVPDSLRLDESGPSYVLFRWAASKVSGATYRVVYREQSTSVWTEVSSWSANRLYIVNRKPCTSYEIKVKVVCPDGESDWSESVVGKTTGCNPTYCISYGNSLRSFIHSVNIGTYENISGNNYGYKDFSDTKVSVCGGTPLSFRLSPGLGSNESERLVYWRVWADLNKDGDFIDANEQLFESAELNTSNVVFVWHVPTGLSPGDVRLRISMDSKSFALPCAVNDTRDVEDYTLQICGASAGIQLSPAQLNFEWEGGSAPVRVTSDASWQATAKVSWVQLPVSTGTSGTKEIWIDCAESIGLTGRTGIVEFRSGTQVVSLTVRQRGHLISTEQVFASAAGTVAPFQLNSDLSWRITDKPAWVSAISPSSDTGGADKIATIQVSCQPNTSGAVRSGFIGIEWSDGQRVEVEIVQDKQQQQALTWTVTPTSQNHTILIPSTLKSLVSGLPLLNGDYIGFFYKSGQQLKCAGYGKWTGGVLVVTVYGDDPVTTAVDGFLPGEIFRVKIWRSATGTEVNVNAVFAPVVSGSLQTHTYKYGLNGFSVLEELNTDPTIDFNITLEAGFGLFSIPVVMTDPDFNSLAAALGSKLMEIQDDSGRRLRPAAGIKELGDFDVMEGYVSQASASLTATVRGVPVKPSRYPIKIQQGWQLIPFWSLSARSVSQALSSIASQIVMVKDLKERHYIPGYGINTLGDLVPGQAYWLLSSGTGTLQYPDEYMVPAGDTGPRSNELAAGRHTKSFGENPTAPSATVVIVGDGIRDRVSIGKELVVLNAAGNPVGAAIFEGENLAFNVYGLAPGEAYRLGVWDETQGDFQRLPVKFSSQGESVFRPGTLAVVEGVATDAGLPSHDLEAEHSWRLYPNPAGDFVTLEWSAANQQVDEIRLLAPDGRVLRRWKNTEESVRVLSMNGLPPGPYLVEVQHAQGVWTKRIIHQH